MGKSVWISVLIACPFFTGCISMAPVSNSFENAKTLNEGQIDLMGNYSIALINSENESGVKETNQTNNNLGFRIGYGITDRFDLKLRYERLMPVTQADKEMLNGINYLGLSSRYAIVMDKLTGGLGLGFYSYKAIQTEENDTRGDSDFAISPNFAFTLASSRYFDLTLSTKMDLFTGGSGTLWHINLGLGISSDTSIWSLRPEIGLIKDLDNFSEYSWFTGGLALVYKIKLLKKNEHSK